MPVAVRVYPIPKDLEVHERNRRWWPLPEEMIVFDTETRTDATQRLLFGSYRALVRGRCIEEALFYSEDLSSKERRVLTRYVRSHKPGVVRGGTQDLRLLTLREFVKELFPDLYKTRCLFVAFNHPFDLARIARDYTVARGGGFTGGFSLILWTYLDKNGRERRNPNRPRVTIKHIDSKRALISLTSRKKLDRADRIPEQSVSGKPEKGYNFRGHFLDLRTLAFALTDRGYSLESACEAFDVEHGKKKTLGHGRITTKYIDYNRQDVLASSELAMKLKQEYRKHPISLQITKAFSPASIGKRYLGDMGILPVLERQPDFPEKYIGYAQTAFYGGRTSAHIRKVAVPVVYTDFVSMYPTVNSLMGLWRFVTAREIKVIKRCRKEIQDFLRKLVPADLFKPRIWKRMHAFVRIIPDDDILPSRSKYSLDSNDWQVALNHLTGMNKDPKDALWFSLPDAIASVLLTGRVPRVVDAFRLEARGILEGLKPIKLRGVVQVDPSTQDFFKVAIEQRKLLSTRTDISEGERKRLDKALKVLANAASYGIYAEMNRKESEEKLNVTCFGIDPEAYSCKVAHPEEPGEYCFPPLASLITGAARLMLALLEHSVVALGGTYAMEDTDSMAIVATRRGGIIPCKGGSQHLKDGRQAIRALSWDQVDRISKKFISLNPYDRKAIRGSILKIEDDNFDPKTSKRRQLYCLAISAKRYTLFLMDNKGVPELLREIKEDTKKVRNTGNNKEDRWSQHGLGHLSNPSDLEGEDRDWISKIWLNITRKTLGLPVANIGFEHFPAVSQLSVSSPAVMKPLEKLNKGKKYADQIKPFNFLLTCHVRKLGHPPGVDPQHFHLIAPYETNPRKWLKKDWINQYTGETFRITTAGYHGNRWTARVKTYGESLEEYEFHPESKCADAEGSPCGKQTIGLLQRRRIRISEIRYIGKEANLLEDAESGWVHSAQDVYTEYLDPRRDEWTTKIHPALKKHPLRVLVKECRGRLSRRALIDLRAGRSRPHRRNRQLLAAIVSTLNTH